jgi:hypothetical protein
MSSIGLQNGFKKVSRSRKNLFFPKLSHDIPFPPASATIESCDQQDQTPSRQRLPLWKQENKRNLIIRMKPGCASNVVPSREEL